MTYKQYVFLKRLHKIKPEMNDEQKYSSHFITDVEKKTKMSKAEVLTLAKELENLGYVYLVQNKETAQERANFIHLIGITYSGVVAKNEYMILKFASILKNLIVPAIVSIICSLIVNGIQG